MKKIDKKARNKWDVCQNAMDHYMSRKDLFCRISRMSAIDETIFDDLMGIVKVSKISSPAIFCNYVLKSLYTGFRDDDEVSDTNILARLMKLYSALNGAKTMASDHHHHFFDNEMKKILYVVRVMFETTALNDQDNLRRILLTNKSIEKFKVDEVEIGRGIYLDVLSNALDLEITPLFGTPQVAAYIDQILHGNLMRKNETNNLRRHVNIFNLRDVMAQHIQNNSTSGYEHIRYSPINMFMLELVSKIFFLAQVSYVSNYEYGRMYEPPNEPHGSPQTWTMFDYGVLIQLIATLLRELGEYEGSTAESKKSDIHWGSSIVERWLVLFYRHFFTNVWNFVDLTGIVLVAIWAVTKNYDDRNYEILARGSLACAAIPQAFWHSSIRIY